MWLTRTLLLLCIGVAVAWDNDWDQPLHKYCSTGYSFVRVRSYHHNRKEDRRYQFDCGRYGDTSTRCYWTDYVNDWDGEMNFRCNYNYVVNGVYSYHSNKKEDRRFKFRCCQQIRSSQKFCYWTSLINGWDGYMDFSVPPDRVIRGFHSRHSNKKEDREWRVYVCRI